jgi:hypothetical protein
MASALRKALSKSYGKVEGVAPHFELAQWLQLPTKLGIYPSQICEIGLNTGMSAIAWLCAFPQAHYLSFDIMRYNASLFARDWLTMAFPGRFQLIAGDTMETLRPKKLELVGRRCTVISIDGGHSVPFAINDLNGMMKIAADKHMVIMDDLRCAAQWCTGPTFAWRKMIEEDDLFEIGCQILGCCNGWCWGGYSNHSHLF